MMLTKNSVEDLETLCQECRRRTVSKIITVVSLATKKVQHSLALVIKDCSITMEIQLHAETTVSDGDTSVNNVNASML